MSDYTGSWGSPAGAASGGSDRREGQTQPFDASEGFEAVGTGSDAPSLPQPVDQPLDERYPGYDDTEQASTFQALDATEKEGFEPSNRVHRLPEPEGLPWEPR